MDFIGVRLPVAAVEPAEGEVVRVPQQRLDALHLGQPRLFLLVLEVLRRGSGDEVAGVQGADQPGGAVVRVGGIVRGPVVPVRPLRLPDEEVVQLHPAVLRGRIDGRQHDVGLASVEEAHRQGGLAQRSGSLRDRRLPRLVGGVGGVAGQELEAATDIVAGRVEVVLPYLFVGAL